MGGGAIRAPTFLGEIIKWEKGTRHGICIANVAFFLSVYSGVIWCGLVEVVGVKSFPKATPWVLPLVWFTSVHSNVKNKRFSIIVSKK